MVGNVWFLVTGGLFLGDDADAALSQTTGHFPDSQDQGNTARTRFQYQAARRMWLAASASYGSGLPFDYGGTEAAALAEYGPAVISRINFDRGRIKPLLAVSASLELDLYKSEKTQHSPSPRRRQFKQSPECNRFRWPLLRQCNRARTQLCAASEYIFLKVNRGFCPGQDRGWERPHSSQQQA
jgi:hypothetical protein